MRDIDLDTGQSVMRITNDSGHVTDLKHGLSQSSETREEWRINADDPLSARADIRWFKTMGRGDWQVTTECTTSMTADRDTFHISAELKTWDGDELVSDRTWHKSIPRNGM